MAWYIADMRGQVGLGPRAAVSRKREPPAWAVCEITLSWMSDLVLDCKFAIQKGWSWEPSKNLYVGTDDGAKDAHLLRAPG